MKYIYDLQQRDSSITQNLTNRNILKENERDKLLIQPIVCRIFGF